MKVNCSGIDDMVEVIYVLLVRGVQFEADTATFTIKLTGGY